MSRVGFSTSNPRAPGVRSLSQNVESLEELKSHPTISQDWTNQDAVDNNRLVALQEKKHGVPRKQRGGRGVQQQIQRDAAKPPEVLDVRRRLQQTEQVNAQAQQQARQARAVEGPSIQDQDSSLASYLDYGSLAEDEDHTESPNSEGHRSEVWNSPPHNSYMAGLCKASRSKRRRPGPQQSHGQDEMRSLSPFSNEIYTDDDNISSGPDKAENANGRSRLKRQTRSRFKIQSNNSFSNIYSHQPPESPRQPRQRINDAQSPEDNNILMQRLRSELEVLKTENIHLQSRLQGPLPQLQVVYRVSRVRHRLCLRGYFSAYVKGPQV